MSLLIENGTIVTASETFSADVLVEGEVIVQIGEQLISPDAEKIDASGKYILPGGIDPHTHFDLPMCNTISSDDHYSGHKAAAIGGTTTVLDFVPQDKPRLKECVQDWREKADPKAAVDFCFHMNISTFNEEIAAEIPSLPELGITSLKVFTAYNNKLRIQDGEIFQVLRLAARHGLLTLVHAENGDVIDILVADALDANHTTPEWHAHTRPKWGAVEASFRTAALAAMAQAPVYIVHMNAGGEVDMLRYARQRGVKVMGETCPQYLFFTIKELQRPDGAKWICSPPMRSEEDNDSLWLGIAEDVLQVIATDHCPFFYDGNRPILYEGRPIAIPGKELGKDNFTKIPNGLPGVGDRLPILWTYGVGKGRIDLNQFVALTSTNPAKIFGLYPRKGSLSIGSDADIVIWDPNVEIKYGVARAQQRTDYNLYEGWELRGYPNKVFLRGRLIVDGDNWLGGAGSGKFLHRQPFAPVL